MFLTLHDLSLLFDQDPVTSQFCYYHNSVYLKKRENRRKSDEFRSHFNRTIGNNISNWIMFVTSSNNIKCELPLFLKNAHWKIPWLLFMILLWSGRFLPKYKLKYLLLSVRFHDNQKAFQMQLTRASLARLNNCNFHFFKTIKIKYWVCVRYKIW